MAAKLDVVGHTLTGSTSLTDISIFYEYSNFMNIVILPL